MTLAAADAAQKKYDEILKEFKPDAKQRKDDAKAMFFANLGFKLLANKSGKGLAGLGHAIGEAGEPALKDWEASNKSLREDMRNYAKDTLAGLKEQLDARVAAGKMTQDHANAILTAETQRMNTAAQVGASDRRERGEAERARQTGLRTDALALAAANRDARIVLVETLRNSEIHEEKLSAAGLNSTRPGELRTGLFGYGAPSAAALAERAAEQAAFDNAKKRLDAARRVRDANAANLAQWDQRARSALPGTGGGPPSGRGVFNYDLDTGVYTPAP